LFFLVVFVLHLQLTIWLLMQHTKIKNWIIIISIIFIVNFIFGYIFNLFWRGTAAENKRNENVITDDSWTNILWDNFFSEMINKPWPLLRMRFEPSVVGLTLACGMCRSVMNVITALTLWSRRASKHYLIIQSVPQREHHVFHHYSYQFTSWNTRRCSGLKIKWTVTYQRPQQCN
jgi:hypothetical protein